MIKEKTFYATLILEVPEMITELNKTGDTNCAYKLAAFFAAFTKRMIRNQDHEKVKECFKLAELALKKGDYTIRNAIENVYLFSISHAIDMNSNMYTQLEPLLKEAYQKQIKASGF